MTDINNWKISDSLTQDLNLFQGWKSPRKINMKTHYTQNSRNNWKGFTYTPEAYKWMESTNSQLKVSVLQPGLWYWCDYHSVTKRCQASEGYGWFQVRARKIQDNLEDLILSKNKKVLKKWQGHDKGHRSQPEGIPNGQIWNELSKK